MSNIFDTIVVGSGIAGLTASIKASSYGKKVAIISKNKTTSSQSTQAQGGINATTNKNDTDIFIKDTIKSSHDIYDKKAISYMCENSDRAIRWLDDIGVPFSKLDDGGFATRKLGGSQSSRTYYSSDYTGLKIVQTLFDQAIKMGVEFFEFYFLLDIIIENNTAKGVVLLDIKTSQVIQLYATNIVLSTGGYAGIYAKNTTNSVDTTGDGVAVALKNNLKLSNMELVQFHPTSMSSSHILISESARAQGGHLVNSAGKRFVDELKPRDEVSKAIYEQIQTGQKVYLDMRHIESKTIQETMPQERELALRFAGVKLESQLLQIEPSAHYSMGGVSVDTQGKTAIKNLYAIGECSDTNIHGANRLGGNSLLECVVFGKTVGKLCATNQDKVLSIKNDKLQHNKIKIDKIFEKKPTTNFYDIKDKLSEILNQNIGIVRDEQGVLKAIKNINKLQKDYDNTSIEDKHRGFNNTIVQFLQLGNSLLIAHKLAVSALNRKDTAGSHIRSDK
ncbi:MAG: succinate dehydrogenase [Epsilonproteobacteria bacterium]|nr:MAG: succinate dehydrogenase [Campylobacterota bacterium]